MKEVEQAGDKMILFIDEMHVMVGAGGSDGAIDASNILKPSLARGKLRCLGATTTDEYAKHIEKDPALARRFQSVYVPEPSAQHTVEILQGLRDKYEIHHRVLIPDEAVDVAVQLTGRYLTAKKFPDKAIDLLDECMSRIRNRRERKPVALVDIDKQLNILLSGSEESYCTSTADTMQGQEHINRNNIIAVEECIDFCNKVVNDTDTQDKVTVQRNIAAQISHLREKKKTLESVWSERNTAIDAIFEARTILHDCSDKLRALRRVGAVDVDDFLQRRIVQKETEIRQYCDELIIASNASGKNF